MEQLHLAICEDDPNERQALLAILEKSGCTPDIYSSGEEFLKSFRRGKYDLVLMDIYMGNLTGVETVSKLRECDESVPVAFITTSTDFALESYRLNVIKYIEKPVNAKAIHDLLTFAHLKKEYTPHLVIRCDGKSRSIPFCNILYLEQNAHDMTLFLAGGESLKTPGKLNDIEADFEGQNFFRCHKSYLVNLEYVKAFDKELMIFSMKEGKNVHIRRESLSKARKAFEDYLFSAARGLDDEKI